MPIFPKPKFVQCGFLDNYGFLSLSSDQLRPTFSLPTGGFTHLTYSLLAHQRNCFIFVSSVVLQHQKVIKFLG